MAPLAVELQVDPAVLHSLGVHALAKPGRTQQLNRPRLKQPCPLAGLAVRPRPVLDDDGVDSAKREQM